MNFNFGICGKLRSGKDTVADYLRDTYDFQKFRFAEGVYNLSRWLYPEAFATDAKPRALLQRVGAHMRKLDEDIWINRCLNEIKESGAARVIVTDVRYPNEALRLHKEGFVLIRVNTPDEIRLERAKAAGDNFKPEDLTHESEALVDTLLVHFDIYNLGTLADLYRDVDKIIEQILRAGVFPYGRR
jgi:dephospho-CoA kinase